MTKQHLIRYEKSAGKWETFVLLRILILFLFYDQSTISLFCKIFNNYWKFIFIIIINLLQNPSRTKCVDRWAFLYSFFRRSSASADFLAFAKSGSQASRASGGLPDPVQPPHIQILESGAEKVIKGLDPTTHLANYLGN